MCGRFTLRKPEKVKIEGVSSADLAGASARYNVSPCQNILGVIQTNDERHALHFLWGLIPSWSREPKGFINARAETVAEKPAYRDAFKRGRRCLVIADGFYEWEKRTGAVKQPWWITREDHEPFAFAGLWATWRPAPDVEPLRTLTIVTTAASSALGHVHDRMPVMLERADERAWLSPETPLDRALALCRPLERTAMRAVGPAVGDARHDEPDCLDLAPEELSLF